MKNIEFDIKTQNKSVMDINTVKVLSTKTGTTTVDVLPEVGQDGIIYFVPATEQRPQEVYDKYMYVNNAWEMLNSSLPDGETKVFIAECGVTSHEEISEAIAAKKLVVCYVDEGDEDKPCYIYDGASSTTLDHWFHCFNSGVSTIKKCVYCKTDSTWHSVEYDYRNVFIARYNETTYDELTAALTTNKVILCVKDSITYEYSGTVSGKAYFSNLSTGSSPLKRTVMLDANGWTIASYSLLMLNQQPNQYDANKKYNVQRVSASSNQFKLVEATSGGGNGPVTLWVNPSPTSAFGEQTISFTNDSYKFIEVKFIESTYNGNVKECVLSTGGQSVMVYETHYQNNEEMSTYYGRYVQLGNNKNNVTFGDAVYMIDEEVNNSNLVPVAIVGWK